MADPKTPPAAGPDHHAHNPDQRADRRGADPDSTPDHDQRAPEPHNPDQRADSGPRPSARQRAPDQDAPHRDADRPHAQPHVQTLAVTRAEAGQKLLQYLARRTGQPDTLIHKWIRTGQVRVDKGRAKPFQRLEQGQMVRIPPYRQGGEPEPGPTTRALFPKPTWPERPGAERPKTGRVASGNPPQASGSTARGVSTPTTMDQPRSGQTRPGRSVPDQPRSGRPPGPASQNARQGQRPDRRPESGRASTGLDIVFEDQDLLILAKPAGLPSQGGTGHVDSVAARLKARYAGAAFTPTLAHRLDRDTSGLLAVGKTYAALRALQECFAAKEDGAGKTYLAWVAGEVEPGAAWDMADRLDKTAGPGREKVRVLNGDQTIPGRADCGGRADFEAGSGPARPGSKPDQAEPETLPAHQDTIDQDASDQTAPEQAAPGKFALARARCLAVRQHSSLLALELVTGRTHQLRAQLAARGLPILGDRKYGGPASPVPGAPLLLHAARLTLCASIQAGSIQAEDGGRGGLPGRKAAGRSFVLQPPWPAPWDAPSDLFQAGEEPPD